MLFVYQPKQIPDVAHFIDYWNRLAKASGLSGIYFVSMRMDLYDTQSVKEWLDESKRQGFDSVTVANLNKLPKLSLGWRLLRKILYAKMHKIPNVRPYDLRIFDVPMSEDIDVWPTVFADWDHTPRTGIRGLVLHGCTPEKFKQDVVKKLQQSQDKPYDHRLLMIKSWNEWAEGNYLEPDIKWGLQYLEALRSVIKE